MNYKVGKENKEGIMVKERESKIEGLKHRWSIKMKKLDKEKL